MTCLTNVDLRDMALYTLNQRKIHRRNELLKNAPHIGSHTATRIWRCTDEYAFRDPIELDPLARELYQRDEGVSEEEWSRAVSEVAETAIVCDWRFNEAGCNAISCNPYYPGRGVCRGFHETPDHVDREQPHEESREKTFAFVTAHNQPIDACQPICYDEDRKKNDTYVGMTMLYANKDRTCFVTDPELLAFYLDPLRRHIGDGIVEESAFRVGKEYIGATGAPAVVATIDRAYCRQYGLDYVTERTTDGNGEVLYQGRCMTDANEGGLLSLSTWVGDTFTKTYNFKRNDFLDLVKKALGNRGKVTDTSRTKQESGAFKRGPPTLSYLADDETWRSHIDRTKSPLPFPLKLSHLGLDRDTTAGLMWTDEYSFLDDGRNDQYGGRLVERPRDISRPISASSGVVARRHDDQIGNASHSPPPPTSPFKSDGDSEHEKYEDEQQDPDAENNRKAVNEFIKKLAASLSGLKESVAGTSYDAMVDQMLAGYAVDTFGDLSKRTPEGVSYQPLSLLQRALKSSLKRMAGKKLSNRAVSLVATQAAMKSRIESNVVKVLTSKLKLPFRLLSRGANALSFVQLVGAAVDLFTAIVYDPYEKYQHYVSDRVLRAMANAELVVTQRLTGGQRVTVNPSEWMANTRFFDPTKDATFDMLLGMMYTRARRVNSEGSLVYWFGQGGGHGGEASKAMPRTASAESRRTRVIGEKNSIYNGVDVSPSTLSPFFWFTLAIVFCLFTIVSVHAIFAGNRHVRKKHRDKARDVGKKRRLKTVPGAR